MDIRNVQKTGNMFYVYLPTSWVKKHGITSKTKVSIDYGDRDSLVVHPRIDEKKQKKLTLSTKEDDYEILQKLITATYISPADSFEIHLEKNANFFDLLSQKKFISFEQIELDGNIVRCETAVSVASPLSLLNTMVRKIRNLITILKKTTDTAVVDKYEDEIDKITIFVEKSVISSLTNQSNLKLQTTDLYYASSIARSLEHMVDYLRFIGTKDAAFLEKVSAGMDILKDILGDATALTYKKALAFVKHVTAIPSIDVKDLTSYDKRRVRRNLIHVSESLIDWALIKEVEKTK